MNRLIYQAGDRDHLGGRFDRVGYKGKKIGYRAPNGEVFFVHTQPIESGGAPIVTAKVAEQFEASHETHTLGDGEVCLAENLRGWDLSQILFQCDSWARGFEIWRETGKFPPSPSDTFRQR